MVTNTTDTQQRVFEERIQREHLRPLWRLRPPGAHIEPNSKQKGHHWAWSKLRSRILEAGQLVPLGAEGSDRRVLVLQNPHGGEAPATTRSLVAAIQLVHGRERAPVHRHTPAAIRFVIEGKGAVTFVEGEPCSMESCDLILTPNWTWHGHVNDGEEPVIWMDGLDAPFVHSLDAWFQEEPQGREPNVPPAKRLDDSLLKFGHGTLLPTWYQHGHAYSPLMRYRGQDALPHLLALTDEKGSPFDGVALAYVSPVSGGPVLPTIACWLQLLRPGERTRAHRHTSSAVYHVVSGRGYSVINGERFDWEEHDILALPNWAWHEHVNRSTVDPVILFSFTDAPVLDALDLYREEAFPENEGFQPIILGKR